MAGGSPALGDSAGIRAIIISFLVPGLQEIRENVDRQREHNCWVLLRRDCVEGLKGRRMVIKCTIFLYTTIHPIYTCKYRNCNAAGESPITSEASRNARLAFCSPSAAITLARASRAASASAAIARCNCTGRRTSLLQKAKKREKSNKNKSSCVNAWLIGQTGAKCLRNKLERNLLPDNLFYEWGHLHHLTVVSVYL